MGFIFIDDSKHLEHGFAVAAMVCCGDDPDEEITNAMTAVGLDPETFEFKSRLPFSEREDLRRLRSRLVHQLMTCSLGLAVVPHARQLAEGVVGLLRKALLHPDIAGRPQHVCVDQGIFPKKQDGSAFAFPTEVTFELQADSKVCRGIQLADLAANAFATMIKNRLGVVQKEFEYADEMMPIGFHLWAPIRRSFLCEPLPLDEEGMPTSMFTPVEPYGLLVHDALSPTVADATRWRFAQAYFGCTL